MFTMVSTTFACQTSPIHASERAVSEYQGLIGSHSGKRKYQHLLNFIAGTSEILIQQTLAWTEERLKPLLPHLVCRCCGGKRSRLLQQPFDCLFPMCVCRPGPVGVALRTCTYMYLHVTVVLMLLCCRLTLCRVFGLVLRAYISTDFLCM
jgi:hypothetical protein